MAASNFLVCLEVTLQLEGGYSNNPHDPGGDTNYGITQRVFNAWHSLRGEPPVNVRYITQDEVRGIYRDQYWNHVRGDDLPPGVDLVVFDEGVNSGPVKSIRDLQRCLGVSSDGQFGVITLRATKAAAPATLIDKVCDWRLSWLHRLRSWKYFGRGWTRRVEKIRQEAKKMALQRSATA